VLIASLSSVLPLPDPSPVPLSGLLLVVGPGFELAMGVLTADAIAVSPGTPSAAMSAGPGGSDDQLTFAPGSGSGVPNPDEPNQEFGGPDSKSGQDWKTHDAAILDFLSGLADALALRPPSLPLDVEADAVAPADSAFQQAVPSWLSQSLVWLTSPEAATFIRVISLTPSVLPMAGAALAFIRQWFPDLAVASVSEANCIKPTNGDPTPDPDAWCIDLTSCTEATVTEPGDPWLAAACALGLVHGIWSAESRGRKGSEIASRRARFPHQPRPTEY
jgi:hypothetical protein